MATTLKRTQMYFPEEMLKQVKQVADQEHTTIAEIVRNAVGEFIKKKKKVIDWDNDPLWEVIGHVEGSGCTDVAENHDVYLYGGKK